LRPFYYQTTEEASGILVVYRLKSIIEDTSLTLPFTLYNNWRTNEAFIRLDTTLMEGPLVDFVVIDSAGILRDTLLLPDAYNESQYFFARDLFKAIRNQRRIGLYTEESLKWLSDYQVKSIHRTLTDYFRLVGKL
jgi:hypothetical protein